MPLIKKGKEANEAIKIIEKMDETRYSCCMSPPMKYPLPGYCRIENDSTYRAKYLEENWLERYGSHLTHYTSMKGLVGIIQSGGFWLSDHRFLNDSEEYHNGRKLVLSIISRLLDKKRHSHFHPVLIKTASLLEYEQEPPQYMCSFSVKPDSLDQWRAYAPGQQGVAMTFENHPRDGQSHFIIPHIMQMYRIIYCDDVKTMMLVRTLAKYSKECAKDRENGLETEVDQWAHWLANALALEFITFKHAAYESEAETRMVVPSCSTDFSRKVHHRVTKNRIVPYLLSTDLYKDRLEKDTVPLLPITEIRVGPTASQLVTMRSIEEFLNQTGYGHVPVVESTIPFRE